MNNPNFLPNFLFQLLCCPAGISRKNFDVFCRNFLINNSGNNVFNIFCKVIIFTNFGKAFGDFFSFIDEENFIVFYRSTFINIHRESKNGE